jgi:sec-independent protein translocase protein TatA
MRRFPLAGLTQAHLNIVLVVALLVIGPGKLPDVGAGLGKSIREFRRASRDVDTATAIGPGETPNRSELVGAIRPASEHRSGPRVP